MAVGMVVAGRIGAVTWRISGVESVKWSQELRETGVLSCCTCCAESYILARPMAGPGVRVQAT